MLRAKTATTGARWYGQFFIGPGQREADVATMTASVNGPLRNRIVHGTVRLQPLAVRQNSIGRERHNYRMVEGLCDSDGFFVPPAAVSACIARKSISPPSSPDRGWASRRSTRELGSSASSTMIWDISTWSGEPCKPSTTPSSQGCHLCLKYILSPMSPGRTRKHWSGRRESNPRHSAWEADVLPLNYARILLLYQYVI